MKMATDVKKLQQEGKAQQKQEARVGATVFPKKNIIRDSRTRRIKHQEHFMAKNL